MDISVVYTSHKVLLTIEGDCCLGKDIHDRWSLNRRKAPIRCLYSLGVQLISVLLVDHCIFVFSIQ